VANNTNQTFDITIIGSGPGGYVAAIRAAQLGLKTAVVEKESQPGGTCLHRGCIPTKALLHVAELLDTAAEAKTFGVDIEAATLNLPGAHRYKKKVVQSNAKGVEFLFKKNGVSLIRGRGRLAGPGKVEVTPPEGEAFALETTHTILATGSAVHGLPGVEFDGKKIISSDDALELAKVPGSMIVLGAGAVGVEFASIYRSFGAEVTLVELLPRLVPIEDEALGTELAKAFKRRGIASHTSTRVTEVTTKGDGVQVKAGKGGKPLELAADLLLVAVGRRPVTDDLGLESTRVRLDEHGFVEVDEMLRTGEPGVYAIGDILPTQALAHVASHEGTLAVEHAAGLNPQALDYDRVPSCTYCQPEVASVGLSEQAARERGHDVAVGRFPFTAIGKAKILGDTRGFVKIVSEKRYDQVLGVHIVGPHATELIAEAAAALSLEATTESIIHTIHAHPTLAEAMGEAALAVHDRAIHF
jgi:dihydrolipoamide dehydrogenase